MGKKKNYLKVGDIIELKPGHEVYAMVEARSVYANRKYSRKLTQTNVTLNEENFSHLLGEFVVIAAVKEAGDSDPHDPWPGGWKVTCRSLADPMIEVSFYQSGCFTAMITDIEPVRTLTQKKLAELIYFEVDSEEYLRLKRELAQEKAAHADTKRILRKVRKVLDNV